MPGSSFVPEAGKRGQGKTALPRTRAPQEEPRGQTLVVAIGASAGGLDALKAFLAAAPPETGMAYVILQHLAPTHESLLASILAGQTRMTVEPATDGVKLDPDHVYVGPPGKDITFNGGLLRLAPAPDAPGVHFPIDKMLRSLADNYGESAIAVILTGTGTDGTRGVQAVKANGGTVIVQDPKTAASPGMPQSAISTGLADLVLSLEDIPPRLWELAHDPLLRNTASEPPTPKDGMDEVLELLRGPNGYDFRPYKQSTLIRRIQRRMGLHGKSQIAEYCALLRNDAQELQRLQMDLLISVTSMFRDPDSFAQLAKAIQAAFENDRGNAPIRAWVAGCATGEEAYSVAMTLIEARDATEAKMPVQLFATDVSVAALAIARKGAYSEGAIAEISQERRDEFFVKADANTYSIKKEIREKIVFAAHNLLVDPPFFNLDLIACRNLLIYLKPEAQKRALAIFHAALKPDGILFLGLAETAGSESGFAPISERDRIYRRVGLGQRPKFGASLAVHPGEVRSSSGGVRASSRLSGVPSLNIPDIAREWLVHSYAPACLVLDEKLEIIYVHGPVGDYIDLPSGDDSRLHFKTTPRTGLSARLRLALHNAAREKRVVAMSDVHVTRNGRTSVLNVRVAPAPVPPFWAGLHLVTFEETARGASGKAPRKSARTKVSDGGNDRSRARSSASESSATGGHLRGHVEALETANEELKAANEQMMSLNEQLSATNEQLETSKVEMEALNEELASVNHQLKDKTQSIEATNNDLINLLRSTEVATLFLDRSSHILRFTPASTQLFTLIPSDVGRPLSDISRKFTDEDLAHDTETVLSEGSSLEKMIRASEGRWYLRRVQPYRTQDGRVTGSVVTFVDVDALKTAELAMTAAKEYAENIIATIREPLLVLDSSLRVRSANRAYYELFRAEPEKTVGTFLFDLGNGQWDIPKLRDALRSILPHGDDLRDLEVEHTFRSIGHRTMLLNAKRVSLAQKQEADQEDLVLLAIEDVTQRKADEAAIKELTESLEHRVETRTAALNDANKVLARANEALDAFTWVVGHDLKEPTRAVETLLTILDEDHAASLPPEVRSLLAKTRDANRRLSKLVRGLLEFSRASRVDVKEAESIALDDALRTEDCTTRFRDRLAERGARLEYPVHDIVVYAPLPAICQVLGNLVENAVKHNPNPDPWVRVSAQLSADGGIAEVVVEDNGPGFPSDVIAGLDHMNTVTRGFGLAIAKRTVELTGGKLWLARSPEGGGAVHFTLSARPQGTRPAP